MQVFGRSVALAPIGLCVVLVAVSACGSDTGSEQPAVSAADSTTSTLPVTTAAPTTTAPLLRTEQLTSCVENAKFQAFIGNKFWSEMWLEAGKTDAGMRSVCEFLGSDDPGALATIHLNWVALQQEAGSTGDPPADVPSTTPPLDDPTPDPADTAAPDLGAPDPGLVAACVNWVKYRRATGDARAIAVWTNAGGSLTAVRDACTGIVRADPAQGEMMRAEVEELESGP